MVKGKAQSLREQLSDLPRAANHSPGEPVSLDEIYFAETHRSALDPERALIVGNRGMGKSFWSHALLDPDIRGRVAKTFRFPVLGSTRVLFGFNGSEREDAVAPTPSILDQATGRGAPLDLWRAVLVRAMCRPGAFRDLPSRFDALVDWVSQDSERCAHLLTQADDALRESGQKLLLLFDALDRLSADSADFQSRLKALLQLTIAAQSYRSLRLKLFLRSDQFENPRLFEFPDGAKLHNSAVSLHWKPEDLYQLLFRRLKENSAFVELESDGPWPEALVKKLAGEFMGANAKRGRVFTWLPTHLADARGQISPRTFLTVWREAASATTESTLTPVSHVGIQEGVRRASADRLAELSEDYPWVRDALQPLRGQFVPLERQELHAIWHADRTLQRVLDSSRAPVLIEGNTEDGLLKSLQAIGVIEVRLNGKVNVPDIFRVEAGIKRKGGVKPPAPGISRHA